MIDPSKITILNVDDRETGRYAVTRILRRAGFAIKEAASGEEALRLAAEQPDLIILDVNLPDIHGVEVLRRLKADPATASVPVLHLTATAIEPQDRVQGLEAGADGYLTGTVEASELVAHVRALLRARRAEQSLRARAEQQAAVAALGQHALAGASAVDLMQEATALVVRTLGLEYACVLRDQPDRAVLTLEAGVGWQPDGIAAAIPVTQRVQAGYTLLEREPAVVEDWESEMRFEQPALLREHGVRSGVTVLVDHVQRAGDVPPERPFGVLGAYCARPRRFTEDDVHFLQGVANIVGLALERERAEAERQRLLGRERAARADAEGAVHRVEEERRIFETLHRIGGMLAAELDLQRLLQVLTDEARALAGARFGAFFFAAAEEPDPPYLLYALSGVPREAFAGVPAPSASALFGSTVRAESIVRLADASLDPRFPREAPLHGLWPDRLTVRSYLAVPVGSRSRRVLGALVFGHDAPGVFTERHERLLSALAAQAAVAIDNARLYQEARAAVATRDDFLARASHELRTPLTIVKGHVVLLAKRLGARSADVARLLRTADRHIDHMTRLITDLLDASRLEAGQVILEARPIDLKTVATEAIAYTAPLAEAAEVTLVEAVPHHLTVVGDPLKLEQVFVNLLTNAVKHTRAGGRVRVDGRWLDDVVELRVTDTGAGIPPEHLQRIFEPFFQIGSALGRRKAAGEGVGLGLAIVSRLVELHGGRVWAESAGPGRGSAFVVQLPRGQKGPPVG